MERLSRGLIAQLVTDHVSEGIVLTDAFGDVVWVNPAFERLSGYTLEEMRGHRPGDILQGPGTSEASIATLAEAIRTRTPCTTGIVNYHKSGTPYFAEISLRPIFDERGELTHFVAVQRDVTSQRRLAAENVDLQAYRRAIDEHAIVSVTDARGRITFVNDNFCRISGYSREELIGASHRIVNSGLHDRAFFRAMWQTIRRGETWHGEICNRAKGGALYWVDTTVVPVAPPDGEAVRYVSTRYEITERKAAEEELRRMADTDALTGLANRSRFGAELRRERAACAADPAHPGGLVVVLDLDHFKDVNDAMGHHVGDLLIKEIGQRLKELPHKAVVARLGGDEFGILLSDADWSFDDEARLTCLHSRLSEALLFGDFVFMPSFSMGAARYPRDGETSEELIIGADTALYEAKRNGRNRWCFFDPAVRAKLDYRKDIKAALMETIDADGFGIVLQPIVRVPDGRHLGFEVLVRMTHAGRPIPPDHFIPLAEELGLIGAVSRQIMEKAGAAYRSLRAAGEKPGFLSINVSAPQFREPGFVTELGGFLDRHGMTSQELLVEITETALIGRSTEVVAKALEGLRSIGVQVALDDFGTGFSSLSHLRDFRVDKVKIDRSFVQRIPADPRDCALVEGLVALAHLLGIEIVAEGIEDEEQLEILRDFGVQQGQGYLFSPPLTLASAAEWLAQNRRTKLRTAS